MALTSRALGQFRRTLQSQSNQNLVRLPARGTRLFEQQLPVLARWAYVLVAVDVMVVYVSLPIPPPQPLGIDHVI